MIWRGQIKAIMAIVVVVGLGITFATGSPWVFLGLVILIPVAGLILGIVNTISTAFSGKPLIYDVKIMPTNSSSGREVHPVSAPISSPAGFCSNCGGALTGGARFCAKCGTPRTQAVNI
jgi:hypothetical protein